MKFHLDGQIVENVYGVAAEGEGSLPSNLAIATTFSDWWDQKLSPQISSACVLYEIQIRDLASESAGTYVYTLPTPIAGKSGPNPVPNNVSVCISHRTGRAGRSYRGRTYVAGLPRDSVSASTASPGVVSDIKVAFDQLLTMLAGIDAVLVIISRIADHAERLSGIYTVVSANLALDNTVDSQRRRLPGRGK